jgi:hypothetical protein
MPAQCSFQRIRVRKLPHQRKLYVLVEAWFYISAGTESKNPNRFGTWWIAAQAADGATPSIATDAGNCDTQCHDASARWSARPRKD